MTSTLMGTSRCDTIATTTGTGPPSPPRPRPPGPPAFTLELLHPDIAIQTAAKRIAAGSFEAFLVRFMKMSRSRGFVYRFVQQGVLWEPMVTHPTELSTSIPVSYEVSEWAASCADTRPMKPGRSSQVPAPPFTDYSFDYQRSLVDHKPGSGRAAFSQGGIDRSRSNSSWARRSSGGSTFDSVTKGELVDNGYT